MVDTENIHEQVKQCTICHGASGKPLKGNRCTADRCKKAYAAQRKAAGDAGSTISATVAESGASGGSLQPSPKMQRVSEPVRHCSRLP